MLEPRVYFQRQCLLRAAFHNPNIVLKKSIVLLSVFASRCGPGLLFQMQDGSQFISKFCFRKARVMFHLLLAKWWKPPLLPIIKREQYIKELCYPLLGLTYTPPHDADQLLKQPLLIGGVCHLQPRDA